jgi:hypothetical protein
MEYSSDLPNGNGHRPLPLELNCEIYKCLPVPIQTKFIWGLGRDIYGIFRHKLLVKVNLTISQLKLMPKLITPIIEMLLVINKFKPNINS